jgi:hypothetical protein
MYADPVASGTLRHRVIFRSPVKVSDGGLGFTVTYPNDDVSTPCAVQSLTGQEVLGSGRGVFSTQVQLLTVRRQLGISVQQRAFVTYSDTGLTETFEVQRVERADDFGVMLSIYVTGVEA